MPTTASREKWWWQAVRCFQLQTYHQKELLVGSEDGHELARFPPVDGLRLIHVPRFPRLGTKRNWINRHARGSIIAHWDDDDWYHPRRLEEQVAVLIANPSVHVTGYRTCLFRSPNGCYLYSGSPKFAVGSSLCYRREYWEGHPFEGENVGEDGRFVQRAMRVILPQEQGPERMVAHDHGNNTSPRQREKVGRGADGKKIVTMRPQWSYWIGPLPEGYK